MVVRASVAKRTNGHHVVVKARCHVFCCLFNSSLFADRQLALYLVLVQQQCQFYSYVLLLIALSSSDAPIICSNVRVSSQVFYNLSGALNESLSSSDSLPGNTRRRCSHHLLRNYNPSIIFSGSASSLQVLLQEMAVLAISPSGLQSSCVMWFAQRFHTWTNKDELTENN